MSRRKRDRKSKRRVRNQKKRAGRQIDISLWWHNEGAEVWWLVISANGQTIAAIPESLPVESPFVIHPTPNVVFGFSAQKKQLQVSRQLEYANSEQQVRLMDRLVNDPDVIKLRVISPPQSRAAKTVLIETELPTNPNPSEAEFIDAVNVCVEDGGNIECLNKVLGAYRRFLYDRRYTEDSGMLCIEDFLASISAPDDYMLAGFQIDVCERISCMAHTSKSWQLDAMFDGDDLKLFDAWKSACLQHETVDQMHVKGFRLPELLGLGDKQEKLARLIPWLVYAGLEYGFGSQPLILDRVDRIYDFVGSPDEVWEQFCKDRNVSPEHECFTYTVDRLNFVFFKEATAIAFDEDNLKVYYNDAEVGDLSPTGNRAVQIRTGEDAHYAKVAVLQAMDLIADDDMTFGGYMDWLENAHVCLPIQTNHQD